MFQPYLSLSQYAQSKYGKKIRKICVDGGMSCPNRNEINGTGGCIYCRPETFSREVFKTRKPFNPGTIKVPESNNGDNIYIVYFQPYSNTYAPYQYLKNIFNAVADIPGVDGISIGTRPDLIDSEIISILTEIKNRIKILWIELGIQSMKDSTLELINRGHSAKCSLKAIEMLNSAEIDVIAHIILGLPGESKSDMVSTASQLAGKISGVKLHHLQVFKNTVLSDMYRNGQFEISSFEDTVNYVCDFLENTHKDTVVHRLFSNSLSEDLVAPTWNINGNDSRKAVIDQFRLRGTFQGCNVPDVNKEF